MTNSDSSRDSDEAAGAQTDFEAGADFGARADFGAGADTGAGAQADSDARYGADGDTASGTAASDGDATPDAAGTPDGGTASDGDTAASEAGTAASEAGTAASGGTAGRRAGPAVAPAGRAGRPDGADDLTVVHLMRHGEVDNPNGVLYGRLAGYHLSDLGRRMAERVAEHLAERDITHVVASPLERAQETAAPIAKAHGLDVAADERLIEAENVFQGKTFGVGDGALRRPANWKYLTNPFRPSWGEPYVDQVVRMMAALGAARDAARGHEAVCVSHQLPIWVVRCFAERRRLWHDPRRRQCTLASLTTFTYRGDKIISIGYSEPARDLVPAHLQAGARPRKGQSKGFGA